MICTRCGKGETQEITGTILAYCPICDSKSISRICQNQPAPDDSFKERFLDLQNRYSKLLEDYHTVKGLIGSPAPSHENILQGEVTAMEIRNAFEDWIIEEEKTNGGITEALCWEAAIKWLQSRQSPDKLDNVPPGPDYSKVVEALRAILDHSKKYKITDTQDWYRGRRGEDFASDKLRRLFWQGEAAIAEIDSLTTKDKI
jgi:hypothetical protein